MDYKIRVKNGADGTEKAKDFIVDEVVKKHLLKLYQLKNAVIQIWSSIPYIEFINNFDLLAIHGKPVGNLQKIYQSAQRYKDD